MRDEVWEKRLNLQRARQMRGSFLYEGSSRLRAGDVARHERKLQLLLVQSYCSRDTSGMPSHDRRRESTPLERGLRSNSDDDGSLRHAVPALPTSVRTRSLISRHRCPFP